MNARWISLLISFIFVANQASAAAADPLRADLVKAGDAYLQKEMSAEDFITKARSLKKAQALNEDEQAYLSDIVEKMPADLRTSVCPAMNEGLCAAQPVGFAESTLAQAEKPMGDAAFEEAPLPPPPQMKDDSSRAMAWIMGIGLAILVGSATMKGKELQIRAR